jgi:hypothetical protein
MTWDSMEPALLLRGYSTKRPDRFGLELIAS